MQGLVEHARTQEGILKTTMAGPSAAGVPQPPEMAHRVRSKDWSKTVLSAAENWPPSLTLS
jgi:hypothetical protein